MSDKEAEKEEMKDEAHDVEDQKQEGEEQRREEEEEEQWVILNRTAPKEHEVTSIDLFAFSFLGNSWFWKYWILTAAISRCAIKRIWLLFQSGRASIDIDRIVPSLQEDEATFWMMGMLE